MKQIQNYIAGEWKPGSGKEVVDDICPSDFNRVLAQYRQSNEKDAQDAVEAAKQAFSSWRATPSPERGQYLFKVAELIDSRQDELAELISLEMGKTFAEAKKEVVYASNIFRFYAGEGARLNGTIIASDSPEVQIQAIREPLGVVLVVTPWNFPLSIPAWKMAPALVTGNSVVLKPSSDSPLTAMALVEIIQEVGVPAGVVNFIVGPGQLVTKMIHHPAVKAITFTGSNRVGKLIYQEASKDMKRVQLEMGGKNPLIVLADANLDEATELALRGGFGQAGQTCTATSRVIVESPVMEAFASKLVEKAQAIRVGNPLEADTEMGPQVNETELASTLSDIEQAVHEGAAIMTGGKDQSERALKGYYVNPTVLKNVNPTMKIAQEEVFGPVICLMEASDVDEAISLANQTKYGLTAAICSNDLKQVNKCIREIEAGVVKVNMTTTGTAYQAPFGGYKNSSSGTYKELGREGIDFYCKSKTVYIKS